VVKFITQPMIKITKILNYGGACPFQIDALIFQEDNGNPHDGYMTLEEFKEKTKNVLDWSETN